MTIVLSSEAMSAWSTGGSQWKAWSSRLITSTLVTGSGSSGGLHGCFIHRELQTLEHSICNTWFKNRDVCKQTWQHPK